MAGIAPNPTKIAQSRESPASFLPPLLHPHFLFRDARCLSVPLVTVRQLFAFSHSVQSSKLPAYANWMPTGLC